MGAETDTHQMQGGVTDTHQGAGTDTPIQGAGTDMPIQGAGTDTPTKGQIVSVGLMLSPCVILCVIGRLIANSLEECQ